MPANEFHLRGHVPLSSPAYVDRDFVDRCFAELSRGNWVVLLGPRQHGKTSGLVRLATGLKEQGIAVARVTLQAAPPIVVYEDLLRWFARQIARQMDVDLVEPAAADTQELEAWLSAALPSRAASVLVDEASGIQDVTLRGIFYRQLRALHDARDDPMSENLGHGLSLLFSGTFAPRRLATDDLTSPFNVCERVETQDLTREDAHALATAVDVDQAKGFVDAAYDLVGGQPFLLQQLLDAAASGDEAVPAQERFDHAVAKLRSGDSDHMQALLQAVVSDPPVRAIAQACIETPAGTPYAATPDHESLAVLGFAHLHGGRLQVRNALYADVAAAHPLLNETSGPAGGKIAPPSQGTFQFIVDPNLRRYAEESVSGAFTALNAGHMRLALVGFGSLLEAMLIDVLEQASTSDLTTAIQEAKPSFTRFENPQRPAEWRLVNLIRVADKLPALAGVSLKAADALRDWRNLVHPKLERATGRAESALEPETTAATGVLGILLRELG